MHLAGEFVVLMITALVVSVGVVGLTVGVAMSFEAD